MGIRAILILAALALLGGCEVPNRGERAERDQADFASSANAEAFAATGSGFDYRYAYRLPPTRLKGVLQSNADACDRLGPARCRILAMRYRVDDANRARAVLTIRIDPSIARAFGDAVTKNVTGSDGVLIDTEISGTDATSAARGNAMVSRLRDQLRTAQGIRTPEAAARAARLQSAIDTIAEVEVSQGQTLASAPVLITYESSTALNGRGSSEANFRTAGQTLENSVGQLVQLLASVGPWCLLMLIVVLILRWIVHGRPVGAPAPAYAEAAEHDPYEQRPAPRGNMVSRWFSRDQDPG